MLKDSELDGLLGTALNWYSANSDPEERKKWLLRYMKKENYPEDQILLIEKSSEKAFLSHPAGQIARCFLRDAPLPDKYKKVIDERVKAICAQVSEGKHETASVPRKKKEKLTKRDPIVASLITIIETKLDDFMENGADLSCDYKDTCDKLGASKEQAQSVAQRFNSRLEELKGALEGDEELKEAYSNFKKKQLTHMVFYFEGLASQAEEVVRLAPKKQYKARVTKPKNVSKKVTYCPVHKVGKLTLKSIDPEDIVGAKMLWVFNITWRRLGRYFAKDESGLQLSASSVRNYDESDCWEKIIRESQLEDIFGRFLAANKAGLRKFLDTCPSNVRPLRSHISADTVILKAYK
jgi:hypothetical protein